MRRWGARRRLALSWLLSRSCRIFAGRVRRLRADISEAEKALRAAKQREAAAAAATLAAEQRLLLTRANAGSTPAQVLAAETAFRAAEDRQAAAGTATQAAEEKLAKLRSAAGKSSAADIRAAEDAVKTAKENAGKSSRSIADAERNLDKVRRGTKPSADELRNAEDQLRDAKSRHADAAHAASEAEKANSKTLDRNSESGRKNRKTVQDAIAALDEKVKADFKVDVQTMGVKAATDKATESMRKGRIKILDAADAAGFNRGEVKKMADQMLKTPKQVETQIHTPGMADALKKIKELQTEINHLKGKSVTITANFAAKADKAVAELNKKIVAKYGDKTSRRISVFSQGGPVWGAGTGTSDDIDAKLSNGEFVVKAQSVEKIGRDRLHHINQTGEVPHFATGGLVHRDINVNTRTRNAFSIAAEPFAGQSKMLEDSAEEYMKGLAKSYVDALNDAGGSYGAASPGKYGGSAFSAAQLANAAIIATVGAGMGKKAIQIALMTAMQESGLRNLNYGDRDSLGLFQQRAPWGSRGNVLTRVLLPACSFTVGTVASEGWTISLAGVACRWLELHRLFRCQLSLAPMRSGLMRLRTLWLR
jgi:hypothetical protein